MILSESALLFLEHCRVEKKLSVHTIHAYRFDIKSFFHYLSKMEHINTHEEVRTIKKEQIKGYLAYQFDVNALKESTVKRHIACLKVFFNYLEEQEIIEINPFYRMKVSIRLPSQLPRNIPLKEIEQILNTLSQKIGISRQKDGYTLHYLKASPEVFTHFTTLLAVEMLFATGIRIGELVKIKFQDINLLEGEIQIAGKGNRERRVFLVGDVQKALLRYYYHLRKSYAPLNKRLFVTARGSNINDQHLRLRIKEVAKEAGLTRRITPHMFRHSCATHLLESGMDIRFVQKLLGHQNIATTERYTHVCDASLKSAMIRSYNRFSPFLQ